jgi:mRNA-degrading endonuclease RelE of RelBE toxin-antitoxin system
MSPDSKNAWRDFEVVLTDRAALDLGGLPLRDHLQVVQDIASLAWNPLPPRTGTKKLKGYRPPLNRLRSGDYRVLYRISRRTVAILRVIARRDLDRTLGRF